MKSFFDKTNAEVLVDGFTSIIAALQLGCEIRLTARRLPDTENRKNVHIYTARIYRGRKNVGTTQDSNLWHLFGVMLPSELETAINDPGDQSSRGR